MATGIKRALDRAQTNVQKEIESSAKSGGKFARGLSGEGYAGGYAQALADVQIALNGGKPCTRGYWD